jgi:hypothetical protein
MHNVHEKSPVLLQTRWAMAYLRGPLTREDIRRLTLPQLPAATRAATPPATPRPAAVAPGHRPVLAPSIPVLFATGKTRPATGERLVYQPRLLGTARVAYVSTKYGVDLRRDLALALDAAGGAIDWRNAEPVALDPAMLVQDPEPAAGYAELAAEFSDPRAIKAAQDQFRTWLRTEQPLILRRSATLKALSRPDEPEAAFRIRLQQQAREMRDKATAELRQRYATKFSALQERLRRSEQAVSREKEQATGSKIDAALSVGTAVLGALFGRKVISAASAGRVSSAMRKAGNVQRQSGDVERATETAEKLQAQLGELEAQVQAEIASLETRFDAQTEALEEISVSPKAADITVQFCGIGWLPCIEDSQGNLRPA